MLLVTGGTRQHSCMVRKGGRRVGAIVTIKGSETRLEVMPSACNLEVHVGRGETQWSKTLPVEGREVSRHDK